MMMQLETELLWIGIWKLERIDMREELKKIVEKFYNSELEKYKESGEDDEVSEWSVCEFVVSEIDEILSEIVEDV